MNYVLLLFKASTKQISQKEKETAAMKYNIA
jgi:hypothetical protein